MHAVKRMREMGVSREQVCAVLDAPEMDIPSFGKHAASGCRMAFGDGLVIVYKDDEVVTVMVPSFDRYLERERDAREIAERLARARQTCHTGER